MWSYFNGNEMKVDMTPPDVSNINVVVEKEGELFRVLATWNVTEEESVVTDCEWKIGMS